MKKVKAVKPYIYPNQLNFKNKPFEVWKEQGLPWGKGWYPRILHKLMFSLDMPTLWHGEARLVFVQPVTLYFDTFFIAPFHEMIPMVWDCWEEYDDMMVKWLKRHKVKKAIFTSEISAERIKARVPELDVLVITEGIDCETYPEGKELKDRTIDVFNYGRLPKWAEDFNRLGNLGKKRKVSSISSIFSQGSSAGGTQENNLNVVYGGTDEVFAENLQNAKVTIAVPRSDVNPKCHETLTQRYWECMLSRMVMVGRAPKELVKLIGYNPVASPQPSPVGRESCSLQEQVREVVENIEEYQELVDRNREVALKMAPWEIRMNTVKEWLISRGYKV